MNPVAWCHRVFLFCTLHSVEGPAEIQDKQTILFRKKNMLDRKLAQFIDRKAAAIAEMSKMIDVVDNEGREMTAVENSAYNKLEVEVGNLAPKIVAEEQKKREQMNAAVIKTVDLADFGGGGTRYPATARDKDREETFGFENAGEMMSAMFRQKMGEGTDCRLQMAAWTGQQLGTGSDGGFAVPVQFITRVVDDYNEETTLLRLVDKEQMTTDKLIIPTLPDFTHAANANAIGWQRVGEGGEITGDSVKFGELSFVSKKSACLFDVSNEFLRVVSTHAPQVYRRLTEAWESSLRLYLDSLIFSGTGSGEMLGILSAPGTLSVAKQASQATGSATIVSENIVEMWARLRTAAHKRAVWVANPSCFAQLSVMVMNVGTGGSLTGLVQYGSGLPGEPAMTMLGKPLLWSENCAAVGTVGDIMLLDPYGYMMTEALGVTLDLSGHYKFNEDKSTFRCKYEGDGMPKYPSVFTPANSAPTQSWACTLATR